MENITKGLKELLYNKGAVLVGIADMSHRDDCQYKRGVAVAVPLPVELVIQLKSAPTEEYYNMYHTLNKKLNYIVSAGEKYLLDRGYKSYAQTTERVKINENRISELPHKTVATMAGIGWIGKNCLLVTKEYGCAIRISSLLTDAPLEADIPTGGSLCGNCSICVDKCPASALKNTLWTPGLKRENIVDVEKCYEKQIEIMKRETGIEADLCGKCFAVCRYTKEYIDRYKRENLLNEEDEELIKAASDVIKRNYDYKSENHTVGAAVRCGNGKIYIGVNVYSLHGACAEQVAIGAAVTDGQREFLSIVAVRGKNGDEIIPPCGNCRQMLSDYAPECEVIVMENGEVKKVRARDLLPYSYSVE